MGTVFLAEQIGVGNRLVALKVLNRKLLDDPDFLMRFENEAGSTGRIHHPNVVTIYESAQSDDGTPYIAMEFLEGESLREVLKRRGALPVTEVAEILQQAVRGLNAAHKLGIIHRDLKPDNIFLTYPDDESATREAPTASAPVSPSAPAVALASPPAQVEGVVAPTSPQANFVVKIVDFGIAKLRESGAHTQTGTVLGTPAYMSFEQASGMRSDELDARSDVYSLGVVVYEMLTGRTPFHSDTPVGYLRMHMQEDPPPLRAVTPDVPAQPQLESVVMKALTKDRNQRYSSVLDFARELTSAAQSSPRAEAPVPPPSTRIVSPPTAAKPPHGQVAPKPHSKMKFVAIAVFALILIVAAVWYFSRSANPRVGNPEGGSGPSQTGSGQQAPVVEAPAPTAPRETAPKPTGPQIEIPRRGVAAPAGGTVRKNPKDGLKYVWIPSGTFMMGCSPGDNECQGDEKPAHRVTITNGFWMGQTDVTVAAYRKFVGSTGAQMPAAPNFDAGWGNQDMPIVNVSWDDATTFCGWAGGRLPTEAEWEYAARAGISEARYGPLDEVAWNSNNSDDKTHDVAQKPPNAWNLYDMLGNVRQWVNDWYGENYYPVSPERDPRGPDSGRWHALRGGCWYDVPAMVRVSYRGRIVPPNRYGVFGFRCGGEVFAP
jgi:serine/threonine-protein kinase